jgi:uncharacterized protein YbaR (Trm112 family)
MDQQLLAILVCPRCQGKLSLSPQHNELWCRTDRLAYPIREQIPVMLVDDARHLSEGEAGAL